MKAYLYYIENIAHMDSDGSISIGRRITYLGDPPSRRIEERIMEQVGDGTPLPYIDVSETVSVSAPTLIPTTTVTTEQAADPEVRLLFHLDRVTSLTKVIDSISGEEAGTLTGYPAVVNDLLENCLDMKSTIGSGVTLFSLDSAFIKYFDSLLYPYAQNLEFLVIPKTITSGMFGIICDVRSASGSLWYIELLEQYVKIYHTHSAGVEEILFDHASLFEVDETYHIRVLISSHDAGGEVSVYFDGFPLEEPKAFEYDLAYETVTLVNIAKLDGSEKFRFDEFRLIVGDNSADYKTYPSSAYPPADEEHNTNCVLLLHMDGDDESTTFTDSSAYAHTVAPSGSAQIDTSTAKWGGSGLFNGSTDYLTINDSDAFYLGNDPYTISFWFNFVLVPTEGNAQVIFWQRTTPAASHALSIYRVGATHYINYDVCSEFVSVFFTPIVLTVGFWQNITITRASNMYTYLFIDGDLQATNTTPQTVPNIGANLLIGVNSYGTGHFSGRLDEMIWIKGEALWTSSFTLKKAPFA